MKLEVGKIIDAIKQLTEDEANELIESMRIHAEELKKAEPRTKDEVVDDLLGMARQLDIDYTKVTGMIRIYKGYKMPELEKEYMAIQKGKSE